MMDFAVNIKDWWAVKAMIASYTYAYQVAHKTTYQELGPIGVTRYGSSHLASYHLEFLALSRNPRAVTEAIREYVGNSSYDYILNTFHAAPSVPELKAKYQSLGYDFIRTGPLLGREVPPNRQRNDISNIHKAETIRQAEFANESLTAEGERIPLDSLNGENIHNFYAKVADRAVGWVQLVTVYPNVGYIHHVYTMTMYRGLRIGSALVEAAQLEAVRLGIQNMLLVPSELAMGMFIRLGYRPLAYFTAFRPADDEP